MSLKELKARLDAQHFGCCKRAAVMCDLIASRILFGVNSGDYFLYRFWERNLKERDAFINGRRHQKIYRVANGAVRLELFDSKPVFNREYAEFIRRDWLDMTSCSFEDFEQFASKHDRGFAKPGVGSYGIGARIVTFEGDLRALFDELRDQKALLEEVVVQDPELSAFNPSSLNTFRVITLVCADGVPKVMTAGFRMGVGDAIADNFCSGGIASYINVETGELETDGINEAFEHFETHPTSGKKIKGFVIPNWRKIVDAVKRMALVHPETRYVGWDLTLGADGEPVLIEGNCCSGVMMAQGLDQKGKWYLYKDEIAKIAKLTGRK